VEASQIALSDKIEAKPDPRQAILNLIPGRELGYLLKRERIKKDLIIGCIGERGGGKSGSGAVLSIIDFAMDGIPIFSNMKIALDIEVDDPTAQKYGLSHGGTAKYRSIPIDMPALLRFDEKYRNSLIFLDEVNVEVSEARRAMSNTNLFSNKLTQELRHLESAIIFTCISEMAVDPRWRDIVDCYLRCEETAYYTANIAAKKDIGVDFKWLVYLMNRCFNGRTYADIKKPEKEAIFHFMPWRGCYNDTEFQGQGQMKYGVNIKKDNGEKMNVGSLSMEDGQVVREYKDQWAWFEPIYLRMVEGNDSLIKADEITQDPRVLAKRIPPDRISRHLKEVYGVTTRKITERGETSRYYVLPDEELVGV
jgi:hypothetical protein